MLETFDLELLLWLDDDVNDDNENNDFIFFLKSIVDFLLGFVIRCNVFKSDMVKNSDFNFETSINLLRSFNCFI